MVTGITHHFLRTTEAIVAKSNEIRRGASNGFTLSKAISGEV